MSRTILVAVLMLCACRRDADNGNGMPSIPHNPDAKFQGVSAWQWGEILQDNDVRTARTALFPLDQLGMDGIPYLIRELKRPGARISQAELAEKLCYAIGAAKKLNTDCQFLYPEVKPIIHGLLADAKDEQAVSAGLGLAVTFDRAADFSQELRLIVDWSDSFRSETLRPWAKKLLQNQPQKK